MNWQEISNSVVVEVIAWGVTVIITAVGSGVLSFLKGRRKGESISVQAVERKNKVFQPLVDELENQAYGEWGISQRLETPRLDECVINSYKYAFDDNLKQTLQQLYDLHCAFNDINSLTVAHSVVCKIFEMGYEKLYGSIVDGISYREIADGEYIDEEVIAEPVNSIHMYNEKMYKKLLDKEGFPDASVFVPVEDCPEGGYYEAIYSDLRNEYAGAFNTYINGQKYELPKCQIDIKMPPEDYIAYQYDFFEIFNKEERIVKKYEIKEEIILLSQSIVQELKERIEKIVKTYEVEQI